MYDQSHHKPTGSVPGQQNHSCPPGLKIVYSDQARQYRVGTQNPGYLSQMLTNFLDWLAGSGQKKKSQKGLYASSCFSHPLVIPTTLPDYGFRPRIDPPKTNQNHKF